MQCANPTAYERKHLDLNPSWDYVQLKKILVDPDYLGQGISNQLLNLSLELAYKHNKDWVADVNSSNNRMVNFLAKYNISKRYEWKTPRNTTMNRFGI